MTGARFRSTLQRVLMLCCVTLLLAGCASTPPTTPLGIRDQWSGRLALNINAEPPQSYSAGFELSGSPTQGELTLQTPLGSLLARLRWSPAGAELRQGDRVTLRPTLDQLTTDLAGAQLPVVALFDWLTGRPSGVEGWVADLSRQPEGRIVARRLQPLPTAELRLILDQ